MIDFEKLDAADEAEIAAAQAARSAAAAADGRLFFWLYWVGGLIIAAGMAWSFTQKARGAPAPLPKREKPQRHLIPVVCTARWGSTSYRTTFAPGGNYSADWLEGSSRWVGSWSLADSPDGPVLAIHERLEHGDHWLLHTIPLRECRRLGRGTWEGIFSIEEAK